MDKRQEASLNRHNAVVQFCDESLAGINPAPVIVSTYASYKQTVTDIIVNSQVQLSNASGVAKDKRNAKIAAAAAVSEVGGLLYNLFDDTGDSAAKAKVDYSYSDLLETKDAELPQRLADILAIAETHKAAAVPYGLTAEMLTGAQAAYTLYNDKAPTTKLAKGSKKTATATLETLFKQADKLLNDKLAKLLAPYKKKAPEFYEGFVAVNVVDNAAKRKKEVKPE